MFFFVRGINSIITQIVQFVKSFFKKFFEKIRPNICSLGSLKLKRGFIAFHITEPTYYLKGFIAFVFREKTDYLSFID